MALNIGIIGDFDPDKPSHIATNEGLRHAAEALKLDLDIRWLPTKQLKDRSMEPELRNFNAFWCSPGSPYNSLDGALKAIRFARENNWPFIGT